MQRENYATNTGMRTHSVIIQSKVLKQVHIDRFELFIVTGVMI